MLVGGISSFIFGCGMPGFSLFFGEMINGLGTSQSGDFSTLKTSALLMCWLGVAMFFMSWLQVTAWAIFAQRRAHHVRLQYFEACLAQDADFYDR